MNVQGQDFSWVTDEQPFQDYLMSKSIISTQNSLLEDLNNEYAGPSLPHSHWQMALSSLSSK